MLAVNIAVVIGVFIVAAVIAESTKPSSSFDDPYPGPSGLGRLLLFLARLAVIAYFVVLEGRPEGQTLGKKALGIRVVRKNNGAPLGFGLALGRTFARLADTFTLGLGLLWAAWDPQHQTFHDKMAGSKRRQQIAGFEQLHHQRNTSASTRFSHAHVCLLQTRGRHRVAGKNLLMRNHTE